MAQITFDYDPWVEGKDIMPYNPGSTLGYGAINSGVDIINRPANRQKAVTARNRPTVDSVIEILEASIEWLRRYEMPATELQSRVKAYKVSSTSTKRQEVLKSAHGKARTISDVRNIKRRIDPEKVVVR